MGVFVLLVSSLKEASESSDSEVEDQGKSIQEFVFLVLLILFTGFLYLVFKKTHKIKHYILLYTKVSTSFIRMPKMHQIPLYVSTKFMIIIRVVTNLEYGM